MTRYRVILRGAFLAVTVSAAILSLPQALFAQDVDPPGGNADPGTIGTAGQSGVTIDADGVVKRQVFRDPTGELTRRRIAEARAALDANVAKRSELRKVSLRRLEAAIRQQIAQGRSPTDAMRNLAGLTRVQYVFYYPDTRDIVIAGPAEAWGEDLSGRVRGLETGRPTVLLEDLVTALRAYAPKGRPAGLVGCSIDPTEEGLARMQAFLSKLGRSFSGRPNRQIEQFIVNGLRDSLGLQVVSVLGVSAKTHMAKVMVEADYRMKLIGIGLERPPVKLASYVSLASPTSVARNAMQRWYFMPDYKCVRVAEDEMAMELVGDGVKLVGENEVVGQDGSRQAAGTVDRASQAFVQGFTKAYPNLAARSPVYAQLRNCIDLLVAAAFIRDRDYYGKADWDLGVLADESKVPVETQNAPEQVATAVNAIWKRNRLMTPLGGGVTIHPTQALASANLLADDQGAVGAARQSIDAKSLPAGKWWWD